MSGSTPLPDPYTSGFPSVGDPGGQTAVVPILGTGTTGIPDSLVDVATCGPWEVRGCSSRGMSHRYLGTPRQDAFALAADGSWVVAAVCDGVSSGKESHVAADTAARSICKLVLDALGRDGTVDWGMVSQRVSRRIIEEARYRQLVDLSGITDPLEVLRVVREVMSTTAVVAVVSQHEGDDGTLAGELAVIAGDSGAYRLSPEGVIPLLGGKDDEGTFTSGSVRPLPGPVRPQVIRFDIEPGEAVLLVSDGVGDPLGDGDSALGRMLATSWSTPPPIGRFLDEVNFLMRTYDDDRTAVGLWWTGPAVDRPEPESSEVAMLATDGEPAAGESGQSPSDGRVLMTQPNEEPTPGAVDQFAGIGTSEPTPHVVAAAPTSRDTDVETDGGRDVEAGSA